MNKNQGLSVAAWVVGLIVAYILFIGPASALCDKGVLSEEDCQFFYQPMVRLIYTPVVGHLLIEYIEWWN